MMPYNIQTEAGKQLWEKINQEHGSSVWGPVGAGIEAIEAEVELRIIKLLEELGAIRRDALGDLVAFNTEGTEVIYLPGLETNER